VEEAPEDASETVESPAQTDAQDAGADATERAGYEARASNRRPTAAPRAGRLDRFIIAVHSCPKMKTHSGRGRSDFKVTAPRGKVRGRHPFTSHILEEESPPKKNAVHSAAPKSCTRPMSLRISGCSGWATNDPRKGVQSDAEEERARNARSGQRASGRGYSIPSARQEALLKAGRLPTTATGATARRDLPQATGSPHQRRARDQRHELTRSLCPPCLTAWPASELDRKVLSRHRVRDATPSDVLPRSPERRSAAA